ncbi:MAG TPA: FAD-dependent oxidoreductase [Chloroflexia bacterium]|nr:FAD-dependent oxidoreductase [Chloroflexia bacterium]
MRVAIVGGGLAGLACAAELTEAGLDVVVLEKRPVLGGKVSSWKDAQGDPIESGLHVFFGCYKQLLPFLKRVDAYKNIGWKEHTILVARPGGKTARLHFPNIPAPFSGIYAFSWNDLFNWREKLLNIGGLFVLYIRGLDYIKKLDQYSYARWHRKQRMSQSVLDKLWNSIALSLGFIGAEDMSARPMTTVFHYFARSTKASQVGFLDGAPEEKLFEPIRRFIEARGGAFRLNARAQKICLDASGERVTGIQLTDGSLIEADAYVLATPLHSTRQLLPAELRRFPTFDNLWKLKSVPVMNVQIWYDRKVCQTDNLFFTSDACFSVFADMSLTSPQAYGNHNGSMVEMVVAPAAPLWKLSDEEIIERCHQDLATLWPEVNGAQRLKGTVVRIPNSIYREVPDSDRHRPGQQTPVANLFLAGCYTYQDYMASMEGAVQSGLAAARTLMQTGIKAPAVTALATGKEG